MNCTDFGNLPIILFLIAILYWCCDKKLGEYLLVSLSFSRLANSFAKLTACVYRPWVGDSRLHPYEGALESATGYSFPSGHITSSTILFIWSIIRGNLTNGLQFLFIFCMVLMSFTRCYLSVHFLSDVIGAFIISLIILFVVSKLFDKLEDIRILTSSLQVWGFYCPFCFWFMQLLNPIRWIMTVRASW